MTDLEDVLVTRTPPSPRVGLSIGFTAGAVDLKLSHGPGEPGCGARLGLNAAALLLDQLATALGRAAALHAEIADETSEELRRITGHA